LFFHLLVTPYSQYGNGLLDNYITKETTNGSDKKDKLSCPFFVPSAEDLIYRDLTNNLKQKKSSFIGSCCAYDMEGLSNPLSQMIQVNRFIPAGKKNA